MAFYLDEIFTTRTAMPRNGDIVEIEPVAALKPYVRCFWTYKQSNRPVSMRIIPDCCADIIIDLDNSDANFVGMCFDSFLNESTANLFGIRFYAWAAPMFARTNAFGLVRSIIDPEYIFCDFTEFKADIIEAQSIEHRIALSEKYLLRLVDERYDSDVMNCLYSIIMHNGNVSVGDLAAYIAVSNRTLERKFLHSFGVAPKCAIELIRYQLLWQDCIKGDFDALDKVDKFGYYDQAHMYNDFKKYHGIALGDARSEYFGLARFYNKVGMQ